MFLRSDHGEVPIEVACVSPGIIRFCGKVIGLPLYLLDRTNLEVNSTNLRMLYSILESNIGLGSVTFMCKTNTAAYGKIIWCGYYLNTKYADLSSREEFHRLLQSTTNDWMVTQLISEDFTLISKKWRALI